MLKNIIQARIQAAFANQNLASIIDRKLAEINIEQRLTDAVDEYINERMGSMLADIDQTVANYAEGNGWEDLIAEKLETETETKLGQLNVERIIEKEIEKHEHELERYVKDGVRDQVVDALDDWDLNKLTDGVIDDNFNIAEEVDRAMNEAVVEAVQRELESKMAEVAEAVSGVVSELVAVQPATEQQQVPAFLLKSETERGVYIHLPNAASADGLSASNAAAGQ